MSNESREMTYVYTWMDGDPLVFTLERLVWFMGASATAQGQTMEEFLAECQKAKGLWEPEDSETTFQPYPHTVL